MEWYTLGCFCWPRMHGTWHFRNFPGKTTWSFVGWGPWERNNITCWVDVCPSFMEKWRMWGLSDWFVGTTSGCFQFTGFILRYGLKTDSLNKHDIRRWVWDLVQATSSWSGWQMWGKRATFFLWLVRLEGGKKTGVVLIIWHMFFKWNREDLDWIWSISSLPKMNRGVFENHFLMCWSIWIHQELMEQVDLRMGSWFVKFAFFSPGFASPPFTETCQSWPAAARSCERCKNPSVNKRRNDRLRPALCSWALTKYPCAWSSYNRQRGGGFWRVLAWTWQVGGGKTHCYSLLVW